MLMETDLLYKGLLIAQGAALLTLLPLSPGLARESAADVAGLWRLDMTSPQGATTLGAMTVQKNKDNGAYEGKVITNGGIEAFPIRSLQIQARRMTMEVDSPRGLVVFRGDLGSSGQSFSGTLTYHDGRDFSMTGVRQQALHSPSPGKANP